MKRKGFINIIELIIAALALVTAFTVLFPDVGYKSGWDYAQLALKSRDTLLAMEGVGKTYEYAFSASSFSSFETNVFSNTNFITWHETEGAVKSSVRIACACTDAQVQTLGAWLEGMRFNDRDVEFIIYPTDLSAIPSSDVLLIWGYRDLTPYRNSILNYIGTERGAVEIMDFRSTVEPIQTEIFGIQEGGGWGNDVDVILKPANGRQLTYQMYKMLYRIPMTLKATASGSLSAICTQTNRTGDFSVRLGSASAGKFWICDGDSIYFDTNGDGRQDTGRLEQNDTFSVDGFNFTVKYIDTADIARVAISDSPEYQFADFIMDVGIKKIMPSDGDYSRAFVVRENSAQEKASGVILNNASAYRTAWAADFTRDGMSAGDDMKHLLASLIMWASNKRESNMVYNFRSGYASSLVDVYGQDMMEVYKFELGVGYPY